MRSSPSVGERRNIKWWHQIHGWQHRTSGDADGDQLQTWWIYGGPVSLERAALGGGGSNSELDVYVIAKGDPELAFRISALFLFVKFHVVCVHAASTPVASWSHDLTQLATCPFLVMYMHAWHKCPCTYLAIFFFLFERNILSWCAYVCSLGMKENKEAKLFHGCAMPLRGIIKEGKTRWHSTGYADATHSKSREKSEIDIPNPSRLRTNREMKLRLMRKLGLGYSKNMPRSYESWVSWVEVQV